MKQYVISVMVVGVIGAIVTLLSPEGEGGGLKSHVRLAVGVVLILVCVSPLITMVKTLSEILGHKSVTTTLSTYVHPTIKQKRLQMDKLTPLSQGG